MYYMNTPQNILKRAAIEAMAYDLGYVSCFTTLSAELEGESKYTGFDFNGKFIYTDNPKDFGDRSLHCTTEEFIKALRTFTPQSRRPMAPEVTCKK